VRSIASPSPTPTICGEYSATPSNTSGCSWNTSKSGYDDAPYRGPLKSLVYSITRRSGCATCAGGRSITPFTTLNRVVFAPMPSASVSVATSANPGLRSSCRSA
jgi:hypothetical protein